MMAVFRVYRVIRLCGNVSRILPVFQILILMFCFNKIVGSLIT